MGRSQVKSQCVLRRKRKDMETDHKKRLDGYWSELKRLADRWENDLSDLRRINEISEDEALSEGDVLEHLWDYMEEVSTLADDIYEDEENEEE